MFWDRVSLRGGEEWERGVESSDALSSSSIIVPIISRKTFFASKGSKSSREDFLYSRSLDREKERENGVQDIADMKADSAADSVLWDWCLALELCNMCKGNARLVLPVLVGDRDLDNELYTDFFTSDCAPKEIPDVHVVTLHERLKFYLHTRFHCAGSAVDCSVINTEQCLECQRLRKWTVYQIVEEMFRLQAISISGLREPAWSDCYDVIVSTVRHMCSQRDVECLKYSYPMVLHLSMRARAASPLLLVVCSCCFCAFIFKELTNGQCLRDKKWWIGCRHMRYPTTRQPSPD